MPIHDAHQQDQLIRDSSSTPTGPLDASGPQLVDDDTPAKKPGRFHYNIQVNDRELRHLSNDCLTALLEYNSPPRLYIHGGLASEIVGDGDEHLSVRPVTRDALRGYATKSADYYRSTQRGTVAVSPPMDAIDNILSRDPKSLDFPLLTGIVQTPILRRDGSVVTVPGYDCKTQLFYAPPPAFVMDEIPQTITVEAIKVAVELINDVIADFPFLDEASPANTIAAMMTLIARGSISDNMPMVCVDANHAGTGKGLLVDLVSLLATGRRASVSVLPARSRSNNYSEEELRKRLTSAFLAGRQILVFDNISQQIDSETLAAALTSEYWSDRILGRSQEVTLRPRTMFIATGSNLTTSNEISRRCYYVQLEARTSRPWQGRTFRHPNLLQYIRLQRPALVRALLTLGCAWLRAGSPPPTTRVIGSYEEWCTTVGGILEFAGIPGFLGNLQQFYAKVDPTEAAWESFYLSIESAFAGAKFTAAQLADRIRTNRALREALPEEFADALSDGIGDGLQRGLGNAFRHKSGTRFGDQNIRIEKAGESRNKVVEWVIRKG